MTNEINLALNKDGNAATATGLRGPMDQTIVGSAAELHESGRVCRICLEDDEDISNPFICPC